nr:hypothetical protein [Microbacterium hydrocarbonoxydans]
MTPQIRSISYALTLVLLTASLTACAPATPQVIPRNAIPMKEHVVARAEAIYRGYVAAEAAIDFTDPADLERLAQFTTADVFLSLGASFDRLRHGGYTSRGKIDVLELFVTQVEDPRAIKAVACVDYSDYEVVDEGGNVVEPSAPSSNYDQVSLQFVAEGDGLVIGSFFAIPVDECSAIVDIDVYAG